MLVPRFGEIFVSALFESPKTVAVLIFAADEHDFDGFRVVFGFEMAGDLKTVFLRHYDIADDEFGLLGFGFGDSFFAVNRRNDFKTVATQSVGE